MIKHVRDAIALYDVCIWFLFSLFFPLFFLLSFIVNTSIRFRFQAYKAKEEGKVVVYTTSSGIVRLTFYNCMKVKQILNTHMVKYEEKDLFRSAELQTELRDRIGCTAIQVPQLFVGGQYIGVSFKNFHNNH